MKLNRVLLLAGLLSLSFLQSCNDDDGGITNGDKKKAIENYAAIVLASYEDSYSTAAILKQKIDAFVATPSAAALEECKTAWKNARVPYGQTEAYRFYGGPIDDEDGPEGLINAWPMDEAFIDYVEGDATAGLINNVTQYPTISKTVLEELNESISETSIFTGYHAIEFLLWGQDLSAAGPGTRPYTDYVTGGGSTAANQQRRGQYLKAVAELLLDNLGDVRDEWKADGAYRTAFVNEADVNEITGRIFTAIGELSKGELAGERMFVAVDTKDQENEHSCFSDNTIVDIKMNFKGVKNVYFGTYTRTDNTVVTGTSFAQLAKDSDKTKATAAEAAFLDAEAKINLIPSPFDQAIVNNGNVIITAKESLDALSDKLADVALSLGADL